MPKDDIENLQIACVLLGDHVFGPTYRPFNNGNK